MRFEHGWIALTLLTTGFAGFGCGGSTEEEEPPAASATAGAEQLPPMEPAAPPAPAPAPAAVAPEPPPAAPAANVEPPAPAMPEYALMVMHEVKDFDAWKQGFDADQPARKEASMVGEGVMRGADNDKLVAIYAPATDLAKLKAFTESKELKEKMKSAGVKGKPTVYIFKSAGGKMAPRDKTGLYGAVVPLKVKEFDAFKSALETGEPARTAAGILGYGLGQNPDKPTEAYLYLQAEDAAKLKAYVADKETKKAWKDAGVQGTAPKPTVIKESQMTPYAK